jgi:hypothetical protein
MKKGKGKRVKRKLGGKNRLGEKSKRKKSKRE